MILHLSPLASTSLPSSAGGLRLFQSRDSFSSVLSSTSISNTHCAGFVNNVFFKPFRLVVFPFFTRFFPCIRPHLRIAALENSLGSSPLFFASSRRRYSHNARCYNCSLSAVIILFFIFGWFLILLIDTLFSFFICTHPPIPGLLQIETVPHR